MLWRVAMSLVGSALKAEPSCQMLLFPYTIGQARLLYEISLWQPDSSAIRVYTLPRERHPPIFTSTFCHTVSNGVFLRGKQAGK